MSPMALSRSSFYQLWSAVYFTHGFHKQSSIRKLETKLERTLQEEKGEDNGKVFRSFFDHFNCQSFCFSKYWPFLFRTAETTVFFIWVLSIKRLILTKYICSTLKINSTCDNILSTNSPIQDEKTLHTHQSSDIWYLREKKKFPSLSIYEWLFHICQCFQL